MHIIHITAEMAPIAKVGGLGDVLLGLSRELIQQGHTAEVILPKYTSLHYAQIEGMQIALQDLWCFCNGRWQHNTVWTGWVSGIRVYLIEPHSPPYYFDREKVYGYPDDMERFLYFSKAALEFLHRKKHTPDILHLHEWPAAAVAPLYRDQFQPLGYEGPGVVMTLHNLQHQGRCWPEDLDKIGLNGEEYLMPDRMQDDQDPHVINLLKGGDPLLRLDHHRLPYLCRGDLYPDVWLRTRPHDADHAGSVHRDPEWA